MRTRQLVLTLIPLLNLHATRTFASQSVLSAMSGTIITNTDVTRLANGVEVQNSGIPLEGKRKQVVEDVLNLFSSKPSQDILHRTWRQDAIFEDPLSKCFGYKEFAPQWYGLEKLFPTSRTLSYKVISSTNDPRRITYEQQQEYTVRFIGTKKLMNSTVVIDLDENDQIVKLEDKWNGNDQPTRFVVAPLECYDYPVVDIGTQIEGKLKTMYNSSLPEPMLDKAHV
ncbi:hypothetical protein RHS04_07610 [Rhizoctonia solani]|uniref:SnoaL-like domain-containing protein n=1 Tax=Rhizoctonia solani TaxID=456999 RepID=A0A8H7LEW3_9AGAM|nr:hypothetical protein RHS04_07610 [Rhizoctonia solani]